MSQSGSGTQPTRRPISSTAMSIASINDPATPGSSEAAPSDRAPAGPSDPTQPSSALTSRVSAGSQGPLSADTRQALHGLTMDEYINLLANVRKRLGTDKQLTDAFSGEGFSAVEGSHDCVFTLKTSAGVPLHGRQVQHKETVINRLPPTHSHCPLKRFADANHCKVVYCATSSCPSYRIPSLRRDSDHVDGSREGTDGGLPTDLEMLKAEYGLKPESEHLNKEHAEHAFKEFGVKWRQGHQAMSEHWGRSDYQKTEKAVKGWSEYITNCNIEIVKEAMGNYKSAEILLAALQGEDESVVRR